MQEIVKTDKTVPLFLGTTIEKARLEAAAPDLLEALQRVARVADFNKDDGAMDLGERLVTIENAAKEAIAKAE